MKTEKIPYSPPLSAPIALKTERALLVDSVIPTANINDWTNGGTTTDELLF